MYEVIYRKSALKALAKMPGKLSLQFTTTEGLAKPIKASGISSQNGQKRKVTCPV
jgi:hypothetical protein